MTLVNINDCFKDKTVIKPGFNKLNALKHHYSQN